MNGQDAVDRARYSANDYLVPGVKWIDPECLLYVIDGQRSVVNIQPKAYTLTDVGQVPSGMARSRATLAELGWADGLAVTDVICNVDPTTGQYGRSITPATKAELDRMFPTWRASTPADDARHWFQDERVPGVVEFWPPLKPGRQVLVARSALPPSPSSLSDDLSIGDVYLAAMAFYLLFRMASKSSEYSNSPQAASAALGLFQAELGYRDANIMATVGATTSKATGAQ